MSQVPHFEIDVVLHDEESELEIPAQVELIYSGEQVSPALLGTSSVLLELEFNESSFQNNNSWQDNQSTPISNQSIKFVPIDKLVVKEYALDSDSTITDIQVMEPTNQAHNEKKLNINIFGAFPKAVHEFRRQQVIKQRSLSKSLANAIEEFSLRNQMIKTIIDEVSNEGIFEKEKQFTKEPFSNRSGKEIEEMDNPIYNNTNNNENFELLANKLKALTSRINTFEIDSPVSPEALSPVISTNASHNEVLITTPLERGSAIRSSKSLSSSDDTQVINPNLHISGKFKQPRSKSTPPINNNKSTFPPFPPSSPTSIAPPRITTTSPYKGEGALISTVTPSTRRNSGKKLIFDENNFQIPFAVSNDSFQSLPPPNHNSILPAPTATKKTSFAFDMIS